jgi:alpha-tubulin suppressor-like RCC1 family protein
MTGRAGAVQGFARDDSRLAALVLGPHRGFTLNMRGQRLRWRFGAMCVGSRRRRHATLVASVCVSAAAAAGCDGLGPASDGYCGEDELRGAYCWAPQRVSGGHHAVALSVRRSASCLVTADDAAYCWGSNGNGELGLGYTGGPEVCPQGDACSHAPVRVTGGHRFVQVEGGVEAGGMPWFHSCGLTTARKVYCWGTTWRPADTWTGETEAVIGAAPVLVEGGLEFTAIGAGYKNCGLTASGAAHCWRATEPPQPVPGDHVFASISVGPYTACGLDAEGRAYCWLLRSPGPPAAVAGDLRFVALSVGYGHSCGITADGAAYCWGRNDYGQLGDGSIVFLEPVADPVAVVGGRTWSYISAGGDFTCGVTTGGEAYCWGENGWGVVGEQPTNVYPDVRTIPVRVTAAPPFKLVRAGASSACGLTDNGIVHCWGEYRRLGIGRPS